MSTASPSNKFRTGPKEAPTEPFKRAVTSCLRAIARQPELEVTFAVEVGPVAEADLVAARWIGHGSYKGGMRGASAPAGTRVSFSGHDLLRVEDGRFAEYWVISETEHLLAQLNPS